MNLFDITSKEISALGDEDLRTLVALLCEAEQRYAGLSVSGVSWGGDQNASDGGLDVRVQCKRIPRRLDGFIPCRNTGFQVKKSNITPKGVMKEMRPKGKLRNAIKDLIQKKGAYIIVSGASVSDSGLISRRNAMRNSVKRQSGQKHLKIDYFDSSKLASWVRQYPSIILWLRETIKRPLRGWQPHGNWSGRSSFAHDDFLVDDEIKFRAGAVEGEQFMSANETLETFRRLLSQPKKSVRLAGLSGVGKTRFVQALFEDVQGQPLNKTIVVYADMSHQPIPYPDTIAQEMLLNDSRAILIIDNCPPELHKRLTSICCEQRSNISLMTIEYDVREDLPEETDVFMMEPSSTSLIGKIVARRFPEIDVINIRTIAEFSGGNARIALALAATVKKGESPTLKDEELFIRLFEQRNGRDNTLLKAAEVCSLLYSFEGVKTEEGSELSLLATLIGVTSQELFRCVAELKRRDLVQSRDVWRAILPHAIANRLAKKALESIPTADVINLFQQHERMCKSFTRRLGYLNDSDVAIDIATKWLEPNGWLGSTNGNLSNYGLTLIKSIAPLVPEKILDFFDRADKQSDNFASRNNQHSNEICKLLCLIAYESSCFEKSCRLLCRFAKTESIKENNNSIRQQLYRLFQIRLSGTHATIEQRKNIIDEQLQSSDPEERLLGITLLEKTLKTERFNGFDFSFGARPRNYGYYPHNDGEVMRWFETFLGLFTEQAIQNIDPELRIRARVFLGGHLRQLWRAGFHKLLGDLSAKIHSSGFWYEGWIGTKSLCQYDRDKLNEDQVSQLKVLEMQLRPTTLFDQTKALVLANRHHNWTDIDDNIAVDSFDPTKSTIRYQERVKQLGMEIANDESTLKRLLPELLSSDNQPLVVLGSGVGEGCSDPRFLWSQIVNDLGNISERLRKLEFVIGFLKACANRHREFVVQTLDNMINDRLFGSVFPYIQSNFLITFTEITRLRRSVSLGLADINSFNCIGYAQFHESIEDFEVISLFEDLLLKERGIIVVIQNLYHRFQLASSNMSPSLVAFTASVISTFSFKEKTEYSIDYCLAYLTTKCLKDNHIEAKIVCKNIKAEIIVSHSYYDFKELIDSLASVCPESFLDTFFSDDVVIDILSLEDGPLEKISITSLEFWCSKNPDKIPAILRCLMPFIQSTATNTLEWKPIVYDLIKLASSPVDALTATESWLSPWGWTGSLVDLLHGRLKLIREFRSSHIAGSADWVNKNIKRISAQIKNEEEEGRRFKRAFYQSFE